jgi:hypothetical protein
MSYVLAELLASEDVVSCTVADRTIASEAIWGEHDVRSKLTNALPVADPCGLMSSVVCEPKLLPV